MDYLNLPLYGLDESCRIRVYTLSEFLGQRVILYFLPRFISQGCTRNVESLRDHFKEMTIDATVVGVSMGPPRTVAKYKQEHDIEHVILSDTKHLLANIFGVWQERTFPGKVTRECLIPSTFILDREGKIEASWTSIKGNKYHIEEVLSYLIENEK